MFVTDLCCKSFDIVSCGLPVTGFSLTIVFLTQSVKFLSAAVLPIAWRDVHYIL